MELLKIVGFIGAFLMSSCLLAAAPTLSPMETAPATALHPSVTQVNMAQQRLTKAIKNPEYMLDHWVNLPTSPSSHGGKTRQLDIKEAILLALRYNSNIQNAELDRIIQRYQLRLAHNEFELQYALAGQAGVTNSRYSGVGTGATQNYMASPEFDLKTKYGSRAALKMDNSAVSIGDYNPLLNFTFTQPLLRGFGAATNEAGLLDAIDSETLNKLNLKQSVIDQITQVITAYRALILSGNNFKNQQRQLAEAHKSYEINEKKITAGQLEPTANIQQSYQIESLSLMVEQAENDFKTSAQNLLESIGLDPDMRLSVPDDVNLDNMDIPDVNASITQALTHNAQYLALQAGIRADERAYTVAKNQQLWQLDLTTNVQTGTMTGVDSNSKGLKGIYSGNNITESANVMLTIPLNDISRRSALISAKIRLEKDRLNLIAAKRALITMIKNTINTIESLAKRHALAKRQVELAAESYALEKKKQQAGIASALDVNNTQNQWIQAQMGLIGSKVAYLNQVSALQRILGTTLDEWHIQLRYGG
ncbi:MAG TPA: transporter [Legionella sp.]|nr:transporter [Legionella sp.]